MINKNNIKKNKLLYSYDYNKNKYCNIETNQYALTVDKHAKKMQYILRIYKKGKIIKNKNSNYNLEDIKINLKEFHSVSYNPFNSIGRKNINSK